MFGRMFAVAVSLFGLGLAWEYAPAQTAPAKEAVAKDVLLDTAQPATIVMANGDKRQVHLIKLTVGEIQFKSRATDANTLTYPAKSGTVRKIQTEKGETFSLNPTTKFFERDLEGKVDPPKKDKLPPKSVAVKLGPDVLGAEVLNDDKAAFASRLAQYKKDLDKIVAAPRAPSKADPAELDYQAALRTFRAYRFIARVPYENLEIDDDYAKAAQAGARLLKMIDKLTHTPENPGLPEADYKLAYKGTSSSNCGKDSRMTIAEHVHEWIHDSSENNMKYLGHRRMSLNPSLLKTGFGKSGSYNVMYIKDESNPKVPDYDIKCYPAYGLMPIAYFYPPTAGYHQLTGLQPAAWHVDLHPARYQKPDESVKVRIHEIIRVNGALCEVGPPLPLNYFDPKPDDLGLDPCIFFRPAAVALVHGKSYLVEIEGLRKKNGDSATVRYVVMFVKL